MPRMTADEAIDLLLAEGSAVQVQRDALAEPHANPRKQREIEKIVQDRWYEARDTSTPARDRIALAFAVLEECEGIANNPSNRHSGTAHNMLAEAMMTLEAKPDANGH